MASVHKYEDFYGPSLSTQVGKGISGGINKLLEGKMAKLHEKQNYESNLKLTRDLGLPDQLAHIPRPLLEAGLKQEIENNGLASLAQGYQPQRPQEQQESSRLQGGQPAQQDPYATAEEYLNSPEGQEDYSPEERQLIQQQIMKERSTGQEHEPQQQQAPPSFGGNNDVDNARTPFQLKKAEAKLSRQDKAWEANQKWIDSSFDLKKVGQDDLQDLERFEELESQLDNPGYIEYLKRTGKDIPALMNDASQEFVKIQNNFIRNAKAVYGGRITNQEMEQFLKTVPSLSQTPEGRKRVIANMKRIARLRIDEGNTIKNIIRKYGAPPRDIRLKVDDAMEQRRKDAAAQFKKDLKKPVPKGQSQGATAAYLLAADFENFAGKAASKGAGAIIGGTFGGPVGGLLGAYHG